MGKENRGSKAAATTWHDGGGREEVGESNTEGDVPTTTSSTNPGANTHVGHHPYVFHEGELVNVNLGNYPKKRGLCLRHGTKPLTTSPGEARLPTQPIEGFEATTAGVIARSGGEIGACNLQANTSSAAARQSPSPCLSATAPDSSDVEELGAWIYKNWHRLKRLE